MLVAKLRTYLALFSGVFAISILILFLALIGFYLFSSTLIDHVETQVISVAWLGQRGEAFYHSVDSMQRYNNLLYGPILYLIIGLFLNILSPSVFAAKLPIALALITSIGLLFLVFRKQSSRFHSLLAIAVIIGLSPFLLPTISLQNYLALAQLTRQHGVSWSLWSENLKAALLLFLPVAIAWLHVTLLNRDRRCFHQYCFYGYSLIIAGLATTIIAAKPGAGAHHLLPYLPFILDLTLIYFAQLPRQPRRTLTIATILLLIADFVLISSLLFKAGINSVVWVELSQGNGAAIIRDLNTILARYPQQTIQMGYGENENYKFTFYRFILVFNDNPYLFDAMAIMDFQFAHYPFSDRTLGYLSSCQTDIWLIPKGDAPFSQPNYYPTDTLLFSPEFRQRFQDTYQREDRSHFFDIWRCRQP
jgi:hypothetical protein